MPARPRPEALSDVRPPSRLLWLAEGRVLAETGATLALWRWLRQAPRGDGHPVLVLPGLLASDASTGLLRRYLRGQGYAVHGWGQGFNLGPRPGVESRMARLLCELHARSGRRVSLVGWSLGGAYARLLASHHPGTVRSIVTLGSPIKGDPRAHSTWRLYERLSGCSTQDPERLDRIRPTPTVPSTSIYSRSDALVAWRCSLEEPGPQAENIEVVASHVGLVRHPAVLYALADRLAQPEGQWRPFDSRRFSALLYPAPARP